MELDLWLQSCRFFQRAGHFAVFRKNLTRRHYQPEQPIIQSPGRRQQEQFPPRSGIQTPWQRQCRASRRPRQRSTSRRQRGTSHRNRRRGKTRRARQCIAPWRSRCGTSRRPRAPGRLSSGWPRRQALGRQRPFQRKGQRQMEEKLPFGRIPGRPHRTGRRDQLGARRDHVQGQAA